MILSKESDSVEDEMGDFTSKRNHRKVFLLFTLLLTLCLSLSAITLALRSITVELVSLRSQQNDALQKIPQVEHGMALTANMLKELTDKIHNLENSANEFSSFMERTDVQISNSDRENYYFIEKEMDSFEKNIEDKYTPIISTSLLSEKNSIEGSIVYDVPDKELSFDQRRLDGFTSIHYLCRTVPILSPMNEMNGFNYDEKMQEVLSIINAISAQDALRDFDSPQYQAACLVLYSDLLHSVEDKLIIQTYALAVLFFSVNKKAENIGSDVVVQFLSPSNICNASHYDCDEENQVTRIDFQNYLFEIEGTIPTEIAFLRNLEILNFNKTNLSGTIPSQLGLLPSLKMIHFEGNNLSGTVPTQIGSLSKLLHLSFGMNSLSGTIPSEIGKCANLQKIDFSQNNLEGSIPLDIVYLKEVRELSLDDNNLIGPIPAGIGEWKSLRILRLNDNILSSTIPETMWSLNSLRILFLYNNYLVGTIPPDIGHLKNLVFLGLGENRLNGTLPDIFGNFTNIEFVNLADNRLSGKIPESVWSLPKVGQLILEDNQLTGVVPNAFCDRVGGHNILVDDSPWFTSFRKVDCKCCNPVNCYITPSNQRLTKDGILRASCVSSNIFKLHYFESYTVYESISNTTKEDFMGIEQSGDKDLCLSPTACYSFKSQIESLNFRRGYSAAANANIEHDDCDAVNICGTFIDKNNPKRAGLNRITQLVSSDLKVLGITSSPAYKALCWMFTKDESYFDYGVCDGTLVQRYVLALFYNTYSESFQFDEFSSNHTCEWPGVVCESSNRFVEQLNFDNETMTELQNQYQSTSQLTGTLISYLGRLTRLKSMNISGNAFTGTLSGSLFSNLPHLIEFSAQNNLFTGDIPRELLVSKNIRRIDLSENEFLGTLPNITFARNLESFEARNNLLFGSLPSTLFQCKDLKILDLGKNSFSGVVPSDIQSMENLIEMKLNENNLSGRIPASRSRGIEVLLMRSNMLTGNIPTKIGLLENLRIVSLNHNSLKGTIPTELALLNNIETLHLHQNMITGKAPEVKFAKKDLYNYITDCGFQKVVQCTKCTMCCLAQDAQEKCQENIVWTTPIYVFAVLGPLIAVITVTLIMYIFIWRVRKMPCLSIFLDTMDPLDIYIDDSVYSFIFSNNLYAHLVHFSVGAIQFWLFLAFVLASDSSNINSDWEFTIRCLGDSFECENQKSVESGWFHLSVLIMLYLGVDLLYGLYQMRKAITLWDGTLYLSGFRMLYLTTLSMSSSILYNDAIAETNTHMIVNAVILLFINDLDEQFMSILKTLFPNWTEQQIDAIKAFVLKYGRNELSSSPSITNAKHAFNGKKVSQIVTKETNSLSTADGFQGDSLEKEVSDKNVFENGRAMEDDEAKTIAKETKEKSRNGRMSWSNLNIVGGF